MRQRLGAIGGLLLAPAVIASTANVNVFLQSSWNAAPIALEVLESIHAEQPNAYFPALFGISHHVAALEATVTSKDTYQEMLFILEGLDRPSSWTWDVASIRASVAMHTTAPKIEAYYSYYRTSVNHTEPGIGVGNICESWVELNGKGFCDVESLRADLERTLPAGASPSTALARPHILPFDHVYPQTSTSYGSTSVASPIAILYFDTFSTAQANLLFFLESHHRLDPTFRFIVRYRPSSSNLAGQANTRTSLKGYGVEMVLKKTDYLVLDDRETGTKGTHVVQELETRGSLSDVSSIKLALGEDPWAELAVPLRPIEIADLGIKTASFILDSSDPLDTLVKVTQDFPLLSASIARRISVNHAVGAEITLNQNLARLGHAIWINGRMIKPSESDVYKILDIVGQERKTMQSLMAMGLDASTAFGLLVDEDISTAMSEEDPMDALVDASDRQEGGGVILWWNDLEKDKKYANFPSSIAQVIRAPAQGQIPPIKRNLWNVILVLDLSSRVTLGQIFHTVKTLISRKIPIRFGIVPLITGAPGDASWEIFKLVNRGVKKHNRSFAMEFLTQIGESGRSQFIDLAVAHRIFDALDAEYSSLKEGIEEPTIKVDLQDRILNWLTRVGATASTSPDGTYFFNGASRPFTLGWTQAVTQDYNSQLQYMKSHDITSGQLKRIENYFYDLSTTSRKRNPLIIPGAAGPAVQIVDTADVFGKVAVPETQFVYADEVSEAPLTLRVIADIDSATGQRLLLNALSYLRQPDSRARLALHHLPGGNAPVFSTIVYQLLSAQSFSLLAPAVLLDVVERIEAGTWTPEDGATIAGVSTEAEQETSGDEASLAHRAGEAYWDGQRAYLVDRLGLETEAAYIMLNGRVIGPVSADDMGVQDYQALARYEGKARVDAVEEALDGFFSRAGDLDRDARSDITAAVSSVLAIACRPPGNAAFSSEQSPPRFDPRTKLQGDAATIRFGADENSTIKLYAVLDPVSEAAQKWSSIVQFLSRLPSVSGTIRLNPVTQLTQIPLKRFYRYEVRTEVEFDVDGEESKTAAVFSDLPGEPIFTLGMDVASSWIVSPRRSVHDLDNLRLDAISSRQGSSVIDVTFELEQFAIEGHAQELGFGPPRGLQLQLQELTGQTIGDTQVMANLGYFQLKANPGVMRLGIRPGRGTDIYTLNSTTDNTDRAGSLDNLGELALTSFAGLTVYPVLQRRPGMEAADVLDVDIPIVSSEGVLNRVKSIFSSVWSKQTAIHTPPPQAEINIFTVASGMLYERFASIMILSVLRHTNSTVKFWFIENFLSPTFLEFLPAFSAEYGFKYEVVTYRWPSWLRAQKEKQREIWAYKILFLDVLFPMDLDKVLFVDADQIVRTDLKELVDIDLQGRVYGYAPMGDDKPEMEGFRFWKQGYWKDSLRGRPYHISALYVIDLKRFRQVAAGDRLRAQYQALSGDPNSLANLDQDLPNSMQDSIPIFTLDKSWLWCETWCSQESLKDAKTIDLCQNPLTKEPKLERARKIPEWDEYDQEVAKFTRSLLGDDAGASSPQGGSADEVEALADVVQVTEEDSSAEAVDAAQSREGRLEDEL